jgi:hypothetical protein
VWTDAVADADADGSECSAPTLPFITPPFPFLTLLRILSPRVHRSNLPLPANPFLALRRCTRCNSPKRDQRGCAGWGDVCVGCLVRVFCIPVSSPASFQFWRDFLRFWLPLNFPLALPFIHRQTWRPRVRWLARVARDTRWRGWMHAHPPSVSEDPQARSFSVHPYSTCQKLCFKVSRKKQEW